MQNPLALKAATKDERMNGVEYWLRSPLYIDLRSTKHVLNTDLKALML